MKVIKPYKTLGNEPYRKRSRFKQDLISNPKVAEYFNGLGLTPAQRDELNIALYRLRVNHLPNAKRELKSRASAKSKKLEALKELLIEVRDCDEKNLRSQTIRVAAHDDTAIDVDTAFESEHRVSAFFRDLPHVIEMIERSQNPPPTRTVYQSAPSDFTSAQQLLGRELPLLGLEIAGISFAMSRSSGVAQMIAGFFYLTVIGISQLSAMVKKDANTKSE
jgi:hypothetical protein